jgi:hypothetical protein
MVAFDKANTVNAFAQAAFNKANTGGSATFIEQKTEQMAATLET